MNTYLIPTTKEFQNTYTDIMVVYANTEKEAYYKAQIEKELMSITIRKYNVGIIKQLHACRWKWHIWMLALLQSQSQIGL